MGLFWQVFKKPISVISTALSCFSGCALFQEPKTLAATAPKLGLPVTISGPKKTRSSVAVAAEESSSIGEDYLIAKEGSNSSDKFIVGVIGASLMIVQAGIGNMA